MRGFEHKGAEKKDDGALAEEARQHVAQAPAVQLVAELLVRLRGMRLAWWSPEVLRSRFRASERMAWLVERPDLRQRITSRLTGLAPKAARKKTPEFQAALIDSVLDEGDVTVEEFESSFDPEHLATYGAADAFWRAALELLPWEDNSRQHQELAAFLIEGLLASKSSLAGGLARKPILRAVDVRAAIDGSVWHTKLPLDVRVAIDRARLAKERDKPTEPFGSDAELAIATPAVIAAALALRDLAPVFSAAEAAMDFSGTQKPAAHAAHQAAPPAAPPEPATVEVPPAARTPIPSTPPTPAPQMATPPAAVAPVTARSVPPPSAPKSSEPQAAPRDQPAAREQPAARDSEPKAGASALFSPTTTPRSVPPAGFAGDGDPRERTGQRPSFSPTPSTRPAPLPSAPPPSLPPFPPFPPTHGPRSAPPPLPPLPPLPQTPQPSHAAAVDDTRPRAPGVPPPLPPMPPVPGQRPASKSAEPSEPGGKRPPSASSTSLDPLPLEVDFESTNPWDTPDSSDSIPTGITNTNANANAKKPRR